ncbi:MAG TPA: hypothetical protein VIE69_00365 [Methylophilaceae bacterium]|jgi:hypothetical protein
MDAPSPQPDEPTTLLGSPLSQLQPRNDYPDFTAVHGLLTDTPGVTMVPNPYPDVPPILNSSGTFNQSPTSAYWGMLTANDVNDPAQQNVLSDEGNQQVALSWLGKLAVKKGAEAKIKAFFNGFTNGALTPSQVNKIYDQVYQNIPDGEAWDFRSVNPNSKTILLTPKQMQTIKTQIDKLSPDLRDVVQPQFLDAISKGRLSCPKCAS